MSRTLSAWPSLQAKKLNKTSDFSYKMYVPWVSHCALAAHYLSHHLNKIQQPLLNQKIFSPLTTLTISRPQSSSSKFVASYGSTEEPLSVKQLTRMKKTRPDHFYKTKASPRFKLTKTVLILMPFINPTNTQLCCPGSFMLRESR